MKENEANDLIGCCGLYCGLCAKYQSKAPSRCIGCKKGEQHSWCSIWNCCCKNHNLENCTECKENFECRIFQRRKVKEWTPAFDNLSTIKKDGQKRWLSLQMKRQVLLEELLNKYNEGRSMSYYCAVCAKMPIDLIEKAINEAKERITMAKIEKTDMKSKAKIVKEVIGLISIDQNINLN